MRWSCLGLSVMLADRSGDVLQPEVPSRTRAGVRAADRTKPTGWRAPGSYFPGLISAGTFRGRGVKGLWMVGRARRVLELELAGERYQRVLVQVANPDGTAAHLRAELDLAER